MKLGVADRRWSLEEVVTMTDDRAFALKLTAMRTTPKTYTPTPKDQLPVPWYLDPNGVPPEDYNSDKSN